MTLFRALQCARFSSLFKSPRILVLNQCISFDRMHNYRFAANLFSPRRHYSQQLSPIKNPLPMAAIQEAQQQAAIDPTYFHHTNGARKAVGYWLLSTSALVFGIIVLGGLTRLTESGLSMVDWKLLHFAPPKDQESWQAYFEKYQSFPEYQMSEHHASMSLDQFKAIYWMEHAHRVYGRLLGLFVIGPAIIFCQSKWTSSKSLRILIGAISGLVVFQVCLR